MFLVLQEGVSTKTFKKEYVCDSNADIIDLPADAPFGSTAICIEDSTVWMKGSDSSKGTNGWIMI